MRALPQIGIIDYGVGNLFSVSEACNQAGLSPLLVRSPEELGRCDGVVLPGVGAFGSAVAALGELRLFDPLREYAERGKPVLGICLGMQLLMDESEELGHHRGLSLIPGRVEYLKRKETGESPLKVPQIGWSRVRPNPNCAASDTARRFFRGAEGGEEYYFVHSYAVRPEDERHSVAETEYLGRHICAAVCRGNILGVQFHPERSAEGGLTLYRNWSALF